jgi:hypothetical protein
MAQAVSRTGQGPHQDVAQERRLRLLRSSLTMLGVSFGLIFVILMLRDLSRREQRVTEAERCRDWLQSQLTQLERLPAKLGVGQGPNADFSPNFFHYVDDATRFYAGTATEPVILVRSPTVHQWLAANGRALVVTEAGQLRAEWVTESEYQHRQAAQDARVAAALKTDTKEPKPNPDP